MAKTRAERTRWVTVFNELLGDALRPGSTIAVIVVHHTSRFTRDATHARVVKKELR